MIAKKAAEKGIVGTMEELVCLILEMPFGGVFRGETAYNAEA